MNNDLELAVNCGRNKNRYGEKFERFQVGTAAWYGVKFHGKKTASGGVFDKSEFTAAIPRCLSAARLE